MNKLAILLFAALLLAPVNRLDAADAPECWTAAKANEWYAAQPWLVGCNFLPSTAVNDVEMWQAESFDAATIERELGWAHDLGFNTVRVFLNYVVWEADADGLKKRFDRFLAIANKFGIRAMPTLFDDCNFGGRTAAIGKQPDPVPGVHNSRWVSSPPRAMAVDCAAWGPLEKYVKDMVGAFASDRRVLAWELYNEPSASLPLVEAAFRWAREAKPSQPVATTIWSNAEMRKRIIELSDVLCFHNYGPLPGVKAEVASLLVHGRPVLCTEWMARTLGSRFDTHLPFFKENKIACWNWGFVAGRMQTYIPQGRKPGMPEPAQWFHDILRKDGTPYDAQEVQVIKAATGKLPASALLQRELLVPTVEKSAALLRWTLEQPRADCPFQKSDALAGVSFTGRHAEYTDADTWYPSWASDGKMYSPWTDGSVNGLRSSSGGANATTGFATILGDDPLKLQVVDQGVYKSDPSPYAGRYPCGSLVYNGIWYYGTYCLHPSGCVNHDGTTYNWPWLGPFVGFRYSTDFGATWTQTPCTPEKPLFGEQALKGEPVKIGTPHFVDFGKNLEHSPDGKAYLVAHGASDGVNRRFGYNSWITGDEIYLARVTPGIGNMNDVSKYEFFDGTGWTKDFSKIKPIAAWRDHMGCVTMTYNAPLKKYLMCVTDGGNTAGYFSTYILESNGIAGPFRLAQYLHHFGEQAYFVNIPSKFISPDGRTLWLCYAANFAANWNGLKIRSNPPGSRYGMCLQEIKLHSPNAPAQTGGFNLSEIRVRDPFILADQSSKTYYLYAQSGNRQNNDGLGLGVEVYSSKDLVTWSAPVLAFERPKSGFWGGSLIWAPEVHQFGKSYFMFATFPGRKGGRGTQILRADRPEGPFQILGETANTPPEQQCLDGTPWIDEDGTHWLVYCNEWSSIKDGTVRAVPMTDDWTARKGESLLLFHASEAPWVRPLRPGCFVTDGPFLHRTKRGKLLMIWSSFRKGGDYAVGVAESVSGSVKGPWRHSPDVLFGKDGGHGMIFRDFSGDLQLCLHQPNGGNRERAHFFKLNEDGGRLVLAGEP